MPWLITVKTMLERLGMEFTVTTTGLVPDAAVVGTRAMICVSLQLVMDVANAPLKLTVLVPCVAPKLEPVTVTDVPTVPRVGDRPATKGVVPRVIDTLSKVPVASAARRKRTGTSNHVIQLSQYRRPRPGSATKR